jgi:hypothetical protein
MTYNVSLLRLNHIFKRIKSYIEIDSYRHEGRFWPGLIEFGTDVVPCLVRNVSKTGGVSQREQPIRHSGLFHAGFDVGRSMASSSDHLAQRRGLAFERVLQNPSAAKARPTTPNWNHISGDRLDRC